MWYNVTMQLIRVFPRKTSLTPVDLYAFAGDRAWPQLWRPPADEVHVSVTFTWDIGLGHELREAWAQYYPVVKIGGPAFGSPVDNFVPGRYIKDGVTFTSRGCNRKCPWCLVPSREGKLHCIEDFAPGWIIQDNNFLQCPAEHRQKVYAMLGTQSKAASFSGGLDARLIDDTVADELRSIRIKDLFLAADTAQSLGVLAKAVTKLDWLRRDQLRCYVLIAFNGETMVEAAERLEAVWQVGCVPFAQLYQPPDEYIEYSRDWKKLARSWSRPAAIAAMHS